jgi:hypothetical protein
MREHRQSRNQGDAQASRRYRKTPEPGGTRCASAGQKRKARLMVETEADRPAQAADRRKDRPEERSPGPRVPRKRKPKPMDRSGNRVQQGSMAPPSGEVMKRATEGRKIGPFPRKQADRPAPVTDAKLACPCRRERSMPPKPGSAVLRDQQPKSGDMGTGSNAGPLLRFGPCAPGRLFML